MIRYGYAGMNLELKESGHRLSTCRKATFHEKGLKHISSLALSNLDGIVKILEWNLKNDITFFRLGSDLFPWMDFYDFPQLPEYKSILDSCEYIGLMAKENDIRLTFHPGPYNVLCSPNQDVVDRTIRQLNQHSRIFDMMGFEPSPYNSINIHVGGAYGEKEKSLELWAENYKKLLPSTQRRMTIENDDKPSMYNVEDLMKLNQLCGVPVCFDYFHHSFHPGNLTEEQALTAAISTWNGVKPVTHWSESRRIEYQSLITEIVDKHGIELEEWPTLEFYYNEFSKIKYQAHSDMVKGPINDYGYDIDVMIEAKSKEKALKGINNPEFRDTYLMEQISV